MKKLSTVLCLAVLAMCAIFASSAHACSYTGAEQVFKRWGDNHFYVLAPNGGFEAGGRGWTLGGSAALSDGNESFNVNGADDSRSLSLPPRSSALSSPICMSIDTPIIRMFARNAGDPSSRLRVEAVYRLLGLVRTRAVSTVSAGSSWAPTQQMSTVLSLSTIVGTLIPSAIQVRIRPLDAAGDWHVDDLHVDPFSRR